jgi:hypothetical protein
MEGSAIAFFRDCQLSFHPATALVSLDVLTSLDWNSFVRD